VKFFLLVYDKRAGTLREEREYPASEKARAFEERRDLMLQHRLDPNVEVALLGAESRDSLIRTHSRYFKTLQELARGA